MRNFLYNLRAKLAQFMVGRNGADDLYRFTVGIFYIIIVINLFLKNNVLSIISTLLVVYSTFRAFSRNYQARYKENQAYIRIRNKVTGFFKLQKRKLTEKDHVFRNCPHCKQTLRLPKQKGKHTVRCPKCHQEFDVRI